MMRTALEALAMLLVGAGSAAAQLPVASAATLDKGFDPTAVGGGFAAIAANPAGLAHEDAPGFSLALPGLSARAGAGPVTVADLADVEGTFLTSSVKEDWLGRVVAGGAQTARFGTGATALALTVGGVGVQVSNRVGGTADLSADAVELLLFGNAGRTGEPRDFNVENSFLEGYAISTAALSLGFPASDWLLLGVTGKYSVGNGLVVGRDGGSFVSADPLAVELEFPILLPYEESYRFDNGSGYGMDLGFIAGYGVKVGVMLENVFNTFDWKLDNFSYIMGQAIFDDEVQESDFDRQPLADAPMELREDFEQLAEEFGLERRVTAGISIPLHPVLQVFGNVQKSLTQGMSFDPDFYGGVGAEWRAVSFLPLRAHGAVITDGYELGGGGSLVLGPVHLSGGAALRSEQEQDSMLATFTLSFGSH